MTTKGSISGEYEGYLGSTDLFRRDLPASLEGDPRAWAFARNLIDHGGFVLTHANNVRAGRNLRDGVTSALLRRALITSEAVRTTLEQGLEEAASGLLRTLLEIEVSLRLVIGDSSDLMAKRLAAFHYLGGRRHFQKVFSHADTRTALEGSPEHWQWSKDTGKRMKELFQSPAFDDVREMVAASQYWHGHPNLEAAFDAAGIGGDHSGFYSLLSPFTHANNVDFDFAGIDDEGRFVLKALPQRDPQRTLNLLQGMCLKLMAMLKLYVTDRDAVAYQEPLEARLDGGDSFDLHPLDALMAEFVMLFGSGDGAPSEGSVS